MTKTLTRIEKIIFLVNEVFPIRGPSELLKFSKEELVILIANFLEKLERENPLPTNCLGGSLTPPPIPQHCPCCIQYGNPGSPYATASSGYGDDPRYSKASFYSKNKE